MSNYAYKFGCCATTPSQVSKGTTFITVFAFVFWLGMSAFRCLATPLLIAEPAFAGTVDTYLPAGITTNWQEVTVPLYTLNEKVDLHDLGQLVLQFLGPRRVRSISMT